VPWRGTPRRPGGGPPQPERYRPPGQVHGLDGGKESGQDLRVDVHGYVLAEPAPESAGRAPQCGHAHADRSENPLGQFRDALQMARAAQSAAAGRATAAVRSVLLAMEARALASLGDPAACAAVLHRAERELDQRAPGEEPEWIYYFDELELSGRRRTQRSRRLRKRLSGRCGIPGVAQRGEAGSADPVHHVTQHDGVRPRSGKDLVHLL
jgi:hypothetical protein